MWIRLPNAGEFHNSRMKMYDYYSMELQSKFIQGKEQNWAFQTVKTNCNEQPNTKVKSPAHNN